MDIVYVRASPKLSKKQTNLQDKRRGRRPSLQSRPPARRGARVRRRQPECDLGDRPLPPAAAVHHIHRGQIGTFGMGTADRLLVEIGGIVFEAPVVDVLIFRGRCRTCRYECSGWR